MVSELDSRSMDPDTKPLGDFPVDLFFYLPKVDQMSKELLGTIVCIGVSTPLKNKTTYFRQGPFLDNPHYILVFW